MTNYIERQALTTGVCESCGNGGVALFACKDQQKNNPKVWLYCERCAFAHDKEVEVNKQLQDLARTDLAKANDPATAAGIDATVSQEMIDAKATSQLKAKGLKPLKDAPTEDVTGVATPDTKETSTPK